ncbi:TonB-dependent receptor plug domain-containing protein [Belliella sp. DSM 111904]|uniref:TonB-dependent receptor plug domain-containing protein n=1 Tax=Belliella filtrata TaxID=2923435 RepID=A0ABS9UV71_9BACT|nr:TonB-dependent receptor plug domain-containing protein [Belliella filtrata]MCH7407850.1 TonB-dependent receptor plug domain-containing protein [Belliella filtrata]
MKNLITIYFLLLAGIAQGQDLFQGTLFSADLIMKNRDKISLTDQQADKIKAIHGKNAGEFSTLKWDLDAENEKLKKMLQEPKINTAAASKQMDKILNLETQLKKKQFSNLLAIRSELNDNQTKSLADLNKSVSVSTFNLFGSEQGTINNNMFNKSGTSIKLTGKSTLSTENKPLFVIVENGKETFVKDLDQYDPNEIESVSVYKDATAINLYGSKAANGVVVITMKKK